MRRILLLLLATIALAAPPATLAADPTPASATATARYFMITGLAVGDQKYAATGKLWIEGGKLGASVGCNSIGAEATISGSTLTLSSLLMTEMACPGDIGAAEDALVKFLSGGPITMADGYWTDAAGTLVLQDAGLAPEPVPSSDPGTVVSPPDPGIDLSACVGILPPDEFPTMGGGSGSSGSGTSGSGSSPSGSGGATTGGTVDPGATAGSVPGSEPMPPATVGPDGGVAVPPPSVEPVPVATAPDGAVSTDAPPPVPAPDASSKPTPTAIDLPLPIDPGFAPSPLPAGSGVVPTLEQCRELVARIRTMAGPTSGGSATGSVALPEAADAAHDKSAGTPVAPFLATILVLSAVAFVLARRSRTAQAAATGAGTGGTDGTDGTGGTAAGI